MSYSNTNIVGTGEFEGWTFEIKDYVEVLSNGTPVDFLSHYRATN